MDLMKLTNMKDQNRKSIWALCLSIAAILLCLLAFALWAFEVMPHSVVTVDSFIGACVALLGVIVTIAVGSQIVNVMEVKSAQRKYEEELKTALTKLQNQQKQMEDERHYNLHIHHCSIALLAETQGYFPNAIYYYFGALLNGLQMQESLDNEDFVFSHMKQCLSKCDQAISIPIHWQKNLKNNDMEIQNSPNYHWIKGEYEPLRDDYFKRITWEK